MNFHRLLIRIYHGIKTLFNNTLYLTIFLSTIILLQIASVFRQDLFPAEGLGSLGHLLTSIMLWTVGAVVITFEIFIFGGVIEDFKYQILFEKMGLKNRCGETPIFLSRNKHRDSLIIRFESIGISLSEWKDRQEKLENALNMSISSISTGRTTREIIIHGYKGKYDLSLRIPWRQQYLTNTAILRAGESFGAPVYIDLNHYAHILIGGATGSGKTWLLKLLLMQCVGKDYTIYIADFKGGIDYPIIWHNKCSFLDKEETVIEKLKEICAELERRKLLFFKTESRNLDTYNEKTHSRLPRIVFACDELAELLDTTGLDKTAKENIKLISASLATIARLGRAFGIHLILSTQRPDADILNGQIKNNITYRICGRADDVLSRIILDNTDAADRIPKDAEGIFLTHEGTLFKGYVFQENSLGYREEE